MNYDDIAKKIVADWHAYGLELLEGGIPAFDIEEAIAAGLRRAANEAAWDVKLNQPDESTYAWMEAKYGPRPKENRDE